MKKHIISTWLFFSIFTCFSQVTFVDGLSNICSDMAGKLKSNNKKNIAVLYITDSQKKITDAGKFIGDLIYFNLVNSPDSFKIFARDNLDEITDVKKLIAEGYFNTSDAPEIGKLLFVDAVIFGNYTVLGDSVKLSLKALDSDNGVIIAASMNDLPVDAVAKTIGISSSAMDTTCKQKNTGDYCFTNNTNINLTVTIGAGSWPKNITLQPGQTQCFLDLNVGSFDYKIFNTEAAQYVWDGNKAKFVGVYNAKGQIYIEQCKSKTFIIK